MLVPLAMLTISVIAIEVSSRMAANNWALLKQWLGALLDAPHEGPSGGRPGN
jgi:hypothetical protein